MVIFFIVGAILGGLVTAAYFWDTVRDKVAAWLRSRGLENSALMDAWIQMDSLVTYVRCRIFVKTAYSGSVQVSEEVYSIDEITDPDVITELKRKGLSTRNILAMVK